MLQMMQKKIESEGEKEKKLYDEFKCFCKTADEIKKLIESNTAKTGQLKSSKEETAPLQAQLNGDTSRAKDDKLSASMTIEQAKELRTKENESFQQYSAEAKANI